MKNGKKPTVAQRNFMTEQGVNFKSWLVVKDTPQEMVLVSRNVKGKPRHNQIKALKKESKGK